LARLLVGTRAAGPFANHSPFGFPRRGRPGALSPCFSPPFSPCVIYILPLPLVFCFLPDSFLGRGLVWAFPIILSLGFLWQGSLSFGVSGPVVFPPPDPGGLECFGVSPQRQFPVFFPRKVASPKEPSWIPMFPPLRVFLPLSWFPTWQRPHQRRPGIPESFLLSRTN